VSLDCHNLPPPDTTNGISTLDADGFTVYPNPAGKVLFISYTKGTGNTAIRMYEISGTEVLSFPVSADQTGVDVSSLARGMYFVELYRDGVPVSVRKIILM